MKPASTQTIGWREWVSLPDLAVPAVKAKVDTGARTSCLHTFRQEEFTRKGVPWIRFWLHPLQKDKVHEVCCEARLLDKRYVRDSGGHRELRPVIVTEMKLWTPTEQGEARSVGVAGGGAPFKIEITLSNRESMLFRMLLGRTAMLGRLSINPALSFTQGKPDSATLKTYYS